MAMTLNTNDHNNTAVGDATLKNNISRYVNAAIGYLSLYKNTAGKINVTAQSK